MRLETYLDAMLIARNNLGKSLSNYKKEERQYHKFYYGLRHKAREMEKTQIKQKAVIDFLMYQIREMITDGSEFDFEMAEQKLFNVDMNIDDWFQP